VGCWAPKETPVAVEQSSGRHRLNIHGAIDLETGQTIMKDVLTVDALSTIMLLMAIQAKYPGIGSIHVFLDRVWACQLALTKRGLDNARYHHAKVVQAWMAQPGCRIKLHFVPAYCPHLNPIERLWGLMHRHITHNKCYSTFKDFSIAMLTFLRDSVPRNWRTFCDEVTDNFRIVDPTEFRIIA
jgi:transposase